LRKISKLLKTFKNKLKNKFHKHYWVFVKDNPESKIVRIFYENPKTGELSPFPEEDCIVRYEVIKTGAIFRCKICGKEIKYCGLHPFPSGNSPQGDLFEC